MSTEAVSERTFPDTAAGRIAERYCLYFHVDPDEFDFAANEEIFHPDLLARWGPRPDDETRRKIMHNDRANGRGMKAMTGVEQISDTEICVVVDFENNRTFRITLTLEPEPPHRITNDRWQQVYDFDLVLREATEADAEALADIERRSPVVTESTSVATDRGTDYFASARLMDDVTVLVAEVDGEPAGVSWGSGHTAIMNGKEVKVKYYYHLRIAPEHQKKGLWGALFRGLDDFFDPDAHFYGHFSLGNVAWAHVASQRVADVPRPGMWRPGVMRARVHTGDIAGPSAGRPATSEDAARIVDILNTGRGREEMYVPYTVDSFTKRMSKDPSLYSWDRLWIDERAVVGVWPVGDKVRTIITRDGITTELRPGYVLDYGFEPGAEDEFESLLRGWAGWLANRGMDRMSILTSVGSLGFPVIKKLTDDVEQLVMNTSPPIEPPADLASRGLYADHIYF